MGIFARKKKKLNKTEMGSNDQTPPSPTEEMCSAASRAKSSQQSGSKNKGAFSKTSSQSNAPLNTNICNTSTPSLLLESCECSEILDETIIDSVDLQSASTRDPDLVPPFYTVPESPSKPPSRFSRQQSPPSRSSPQQSSQLSRIPRPVDSPKSAVKSDYSRPASECPVQSTRSRSPTARSPRPESPVKGPISIICPRSRGPEKPLKSPRCGSPADCPAKSARGGSPPKSLRDGSPPETPRGGSPAKCPAKSPRCESPKAKSPAKSARSRSPDKWSECPVKSKNAVWPTKAGVPRKGGNLDAVFCCGEEAFGLVDDGSRRRINTYCVSAPTGPNYAKSEETLQSGTEKSHNGHASDTTSRTTIICACDGDDEDDDGYEDDDSSCDCECEPPSCQVQCCCVSCCPPPDTCNFFRIPPPMPYQQSFQQNGPWCGCCGDARPSRRTVKDQCCGCCCPVDKDRCCNDTTCSRPKSRELRGGTLIMGCQCNRKNGLQDDCPRTGCQGAPPCMTQPQPSCDNQQFSQGKHLEEKWEKEQTEMKVCYCSSYRCAFGPKTRCGPSCTIKVTKQQTKTTKQEIRREGPPSTTSANPAQRCYSGDGNHCPDGCTNWCNCDARMNQNITKDRTEYPPAILGVRHTLHEPHDRHPLSQQLRPRKWRL
ncbi:unnamed protein product [Callosobruchus maculatus]|uniref:Uncharacterized protein n=1 Tax=Callosobruchus maculatus TaxID=64391 RepID=A0A653D3X5_CALMS|nr:unnamed protein product [Callosobruchus maculatus]